ncbi:MAG TPA: hypothetical protein VGX78_20840 [Pirellulales bacterium]|jgi:tetratricopeptide (TPR) repeat protein|nr:hypothetical protein [Pirellulales bacterium]
MKVALVACLVVTLALEAPQVLAQHGRGGGGGFGGGHGGGFGGGGFGRGGGGAAYAGRGMGTGTARAVSAPRAPIRNFSYNRNVHFSNRPAYHGGWHRGDWGGHWAGPYGYRPWGWGWYGGWGWGIGMGWGYGPYSYGAWGYPVGIATIGIGASPWGWGYFGYYNPYWAAPMGGVTYINYSQPVVAAAPAPPAPAASAGGQSATSAFAEVPAPAPAIQKTPAQKEALAIFDNARALFHKGQYRVALSQTDRALVLVPNDSLMHEFRALCLFAVADYQQAAAAVHAVISAGPGWDWPTVSSLYAGAGVYTAQLRALEKHCDEHPTAAAPRFLLAYHYLLGEHNEQAAAVLEEVVRLEPADQLAAQLLKGLTTPSEKRSTANLPAESDEPVEASNIIGHWNASRPDGSSFDLDLTTDHKFSWKFKQRDRQQEFDGTYTLAKNFLILSASDHNALVGKVSMESDDKLTFRLAGGNPAEPGLTFTR